MSRETSLLAMGLLSIGPAAAQAAPPMVTRFTLDNGIRVVVLHAQDSPHFAAISFLPLGLASDGAGRTQWSHLVEHLTLRTTGPIRNHKERNAETMLDGMHLDFMGTTDNWREGLDLQAKWLSGLAYSQEAMKEELPKALAEAEATVANLFTHKWAAAAWDQVVRHGHTHVDVLGDLKTATLAEVQAYRDRHFVVLDRTVLCVIGGVPPDTLKPEIEKRFGAIRSAAKALPPGTKKQPAPKDHTATWDLNARHYIQYYPIPGPEHEDHAALLILSMYVTSQFARNAAIGELTGASNCGVDLIGPEGSYFYVSASLKADFSVEHLKNQIMFALHNLKDATASSQLPGLAMVLSRRMSPDARMASIWSHRPLTHVQRGMLLGNIALQQGLHEFRYGDYLPAVAESIKGVTQARVIATVKKYLSDDQRRTLLLTPK